jgi:hypothetical protein
MRIRDHPAAPRSPWQNCHVERLIGSIRRESLDHLIVFGGTHLRGGLKAYASLWLLKIPSDPKLERAR